AGRLELEGATRLGLDLTETVDRVAERVDDATEEGVAAGRREHLARAGDGHALFDARDLAEHDDADRVLVEVESEAERAVVEAEQLVRHGAREPLDVRDAVGRVDDGADLGRRGLGRLVAGDEVLERGTDLVRADRDVCHVSSLEWCVGRRGQPASRMRRSARRDATVPSMTSS